MRLAAAIIVALAGCPRSGTPPQRPGAPADARVAIARLEAARGAGVEELVARAASGDPDVRGLALRALGRVGGPRALTALLAALEDPSAVIASRAAGAIGILVATTDPPPPVIEQTSSALIAAAARPDVDLPEVLEALGRAGDVRSLGPLTARLGDPDVAVAEAAAIALGRLGRRQIALDGTARRALAAATGAAHETPLRRAAVWALGREHGLDAPGAPAPDPEVTLALAAAVADSDAETRAAAVAALARRKSVAGGAKPIEQALRDTDWRVAVEAVRALAGDAGGSAHRDALAAALVRSWTVVAAGGKPPHAHVVIEGLRQLLPSVKDTVAPFDHARGLADSPATVVAPLVRGWVQCLATAGYARVEPAKELAAVLGCGGDGFPAVPRAQLFAELAGGSVGTVQQRRDGIMILLSTRDPAQRAAALETVPKLWGELTDGDRTALAGAVATALTSDAPVEAGTAGDAVAKLVAHDKTTPAARTRLEDALVARALAEPDAELAAGLLAAIATAKLARGRAACAKGAAGPTPVIRTAGRDCLTALDGKVAPDPARSHDEPPAAVVPAATLADIAAVIGKRVTWRVETSRGVVTIALAPDVAPWHVAAIAALTRRKFYDGLVFHRVVPDFVVQGGDPTGTGWGGPGFTLPAEPATRADGADFGTGAVGIADAGKDSGGSQWFVMHSRAPHLEGRYTRIGKVASGQDVIDTLVIGDRIVTATITIE
jgi:cyclophilin family peptidyl-prolyl cis-trans isomerase/HEAT repeat protein